MKLFENLAIQISSLHYDIRAEVIVNELMKSNDLEEEDYMIEKDGQFSRAYRYDILSPEVGNYSFSNIRFLKLILSRDSIYDMLPENITHNTGSDNAEKDVNILIQEYQIKKRDQKNARLFFQPFENEIFRFGVCIEEFEQNFLSKLHGLLAPELLYEFFGIDDKLASVMVSKLIKILPFVHAIVGNIDLTIEILSLLLEEEIKIDKKNCRKLQDQKQYSLLGDSKLGLDMISGDSYNHYSDHISLMIGPLKKGDFRDYIHEGENKKFFDLFCSYFFSAETEIEMIILLPTEAEKFDLDIYEDTVLGYNTRI